jgi:hypothetical protein
MLRKTKIRKAGTALSLFVILSGFGCALAAVASPSGFVSIAWGKDGASEGEDAQKEEESRQEEQEKAGREQEARKKEEERRLEGQKREAERRQEAEKKADEFRRESGKNPEPSERPQERKDGEEHDKDDGDGHEDETEDGIGRDDADEKEGVGHEADKEDKAYAKAAEKIAEAEAKIAERLAEGKDISAAMDRLERAKRALASARRASDGDGSDVDGLVREAEKLAGWAAGKSAGPTDEPSKVLAKLNKRITQVEAKLSAAESAGIGTDSFHEVLGTAKADLGKATSLVKTGSVDEGLALARTAERNVRQAKDVLESLLLASGYEDDSLADDHGSEVSEAVGGLLDLADIEGGELGEKVREIAREQGRSAEEAKGLVESARSREGMAEFFLGPKYDDLDGIRTKVEENRAAIRSLSDVVGQVGDEELRGALMEQVAVLEKGNEKLERFVSGKESRRGVFGWVSRLFR